MARGALEDSQRVASRIRLYMGSCTNGSSVSCLRESWLRYAKERILLSDPVSQVNRDS